MDHQQQHLKQTEKIIVEMLEFLDSSSEEEISDMEKLKTETCNEIDKQQIITKDINDNSIQETIKKTTKTKKIKKKIKKITTSIAEELNKLKANYPLWNTKEITVTTKNKLNSNLKSPNFINADNLASKGETTSTNSDNLEINCRRSSCNLFSQEIHKALYLATTGQPPSGSADYYQAAQNYALYGKHFSDFPHNWQTLLNDKNSENLSVVDGSNLMTNFAQYSKSNASPANVLHTPIVGSPSLASAAASYYQLCNNVQAQGRSTAPNNNNNSTVYGIFLGNKVTYVAATPTPATPSVIYNQHSTTTTTNFISNSLANAALTTTPALLYTNPMLTTTTQQYLNTFFKETQYLSTALNTGNTTQSPAVTTNGGLYERLIYAQMLQQQLYQTQQAAAVAAMFQHKQRVAVAAAAATRQANSINSNRTSSPQQHLNAVSTTTTASNCNGSTVGACSRQTKSTSPMELPSVKTQTPALLGNGNGEIKSSSD